MIFILWELPFTVVRSFLILLGRQLRAARVLLGWSQIELAKQAKVAIGTIRRMESFEGEIVSYTSTLSKVAGAMQKAGISFLDGGEPGVRLRPTKK